MYMYVPSRETPLQERSGTKCHYIKSATPKAQTSYWKGAYGKMHTALEARIKNNTLESTFVILKSRKQGRAFRLVCSFHCVPFRDLLIPCFPPLTRLSLYLWFPLRTHPLLPPLMAQELNSQNSMYPRLMETSSTGSRSGINSLQLYTARPACLMRRRPSTCNMPLKMDPLGMQLRNCHILVTTRRMLLNAPSPTTTGCISFNVLTSN